MESVVGIEPHAGVVLAPVAAWTPVCTISGCCARKERKIAASAFSFCSWLSSSPWRTLPSQATTIIFPLLSKVSGPDPPGPLV